ncbi:hypothetical protein V8C37DRAFT_393563 [Trichoderma ceciliae]
MASTPQKKRRFESQGALGALFDPYVTPRARSRSIPSSSASISASETRSHRFCVVDRAIRALDQPTVMLLCNFQRSTIFVILPGRSNILLGSKCQHQHCEQLDGGL